MWTQGCYTARDVHWPSWESVLDSITLIKLSRGDVESMVPTSSTLGCKSILRILEPPKPFLHSFCCGHLASKRWRRIGLLGLANEARWLVHRLCTVFSNFEPDLDNDETGKWWTEPISDRSSSAVSSQVIFHSTSITWNPSSYNTKTDGYDR